MGGFGSHMQQCLEATPGPEVGGFPQQCLGILVILRVQLGLAA